jgi:murein DD-endopeptidase MepM/ murein hydrolase activator NlpD
MTIFDSRQPCFPLRPIDYQHDIPEDGHPGSFGAVRKFDIHTGVDLYCQPGVPIFAVEEGVIVEVEIFTGPRAESPWWHETQAILIEGRSGVICYGEVVTHLKVGDKVQQADMLGLSKQVLKKDKGKPMCMLHFELYAPGTRETVWWKKGQDKPTNLLDPTSLLNRALSNI